jgi:hypothetical protein
MATDSWCVVCRAVGGSTRRTEFACACAECVFHDECWSEFVSRNREESRVRCPICRASLVGYASDSNSSGDDESDERDACSNHSVYDSECEACYHAEYRSRSSSVDSDGDATDDSVGSADID